MQPLQKSTETVIVGSSLINHFIRKKLDLTTTEYVTMLMLTDLHDCYRPLSQYECYTRIGEDLENVSALIEKMLKPKGFVGETNLPTEKWFKAFGRKIEFMRVYLEPIDIEGYSLAFRPAPKTDVENKLKELVKKISFEQIIVAKLRYFLTKWESPGGMDYIVGAARFLNGKFYELDYQLKLPTRMMFNQIVAAKYGSGTPLDLTSFMYSEQTGNITYQSVPATMHLITANEYLDDPDQNRNEPGDLPG